MSSDSGQREISEPDWSTAYRGNKDVVWYDQDIDSKVTSDIRELLEGYSKVKPADVLQHVRTIRDKAWAIRSYPCTGLGLFLNPMIPNCPAYQSIIRRLQHGESFLDVGCFLGQDLRRIVADGAPSDRLFAVDIVSHWDLGYEMFRDRDRFSAQVIETDILHPNAALLALERSIDIISITHVFHQWDWDTQVRAMKELVKLSRPGTGAMILGFQVGSAGVRERPATDLNKSPQYWHSPESYREIWNQVGKETGTEWSSEAQLKTWEEIGWDPKDTAYMGDDARVIQWVVSRID